MGSKKKAEETTETWSEVWSTKTSIFELSDQGRGRGRNTTMAEIESSLLLGELLQEFRRRQKVEDARTVEMLNLLDRVRKEGINNA